MPPRLVTGLAGEQLVLANEEKVLGKTLATKQLGLPLEIDSAMIIRGKDEEEGVGINS